MKLDLTTGELGKLYAFLQDPEGHNAIKKISQCKLENCRREVVGALQANPKDIDTASRVAGACEAWESLPKVLDIAAVVKRKSA